MKKLLSLKRVMAVFLVLFTGLTVNAQFTNTTVPPLNGGNGSGGSTFNLTVTAPIMLTEIGQAFYPGSGTYEIWMSPNPINGAPTISAATGWTMIQTGTVVGASVGLTPTVVSVPLTAPMMLTPGTYGFYVGASQSVVYTTYNAANQTTFTDAFTTIETGPNVGYGGSLPNPTFSTRQFNGSVTYLPASLTPDNAAMSSLVSPTTYCAGTNDSIQVRVSNFGTNQLDSVMVTWSVNGVSNSSWFNVSLDTFGGVGAIDTVLFLDTATFGSGVTNLQIYTSLPNGMPDSDTSNDSLMINLQPALSGVYLIDQSGVGDFSSIGAAVNALDSFGVCGPVTFNIADSLYVEQITLEDFTGMSSVNTVTFQSLAGDPTNCIWTFGSVSSAANHTLNIEGSHYTIQNITLQSVGTTYSNVLKIAASSENIDILNNEILGSSTTSTSTFGACIFTSGGGADDIRFIGNHILNGSYGIYVNGSSANYMTNFEFIDNVVENSYYRFTHFYYTENLDFINNEMLHDQNNPYTFGYGMYFYRINGDIKINQNKSVTDGVFPRYGMYLGYVQGSFQDFAEINNNKIGLGGSASTIYYGVYTNQTMFVEMANNSVLVDSLSSSTSRALYMLNGLVSSINNIYHVDGQGYAMYVSGAPFLEVDHNSYYTNGSTLIYHSGNSPTLSDWQMSSGLDSNSLNIANPFTDKSNLTVCNDSLYMMGKHLPNVTVDQEGDARLSTPCIGADEFMSATNFDLGDDVRLCTGDTIDFTVYYYDTVVWNGMDTMQTYTIFNPNTYYVEVMGACGTATDSIVINPQQTADLPATVNICEGTTQTLNPQVYGAATFNWSDLSIDSILIVANSGTYHVHVIDEGGCESSDTVVVTQSFNVDLPDSLIEFCDGQNVYLDADMSGTYVWNDNSSNQVLQVSTSGNYWVEVTDNYGCVSADTAMVSVIPMPVANFGTDTISVLTVVFSDSSTGATNYFWDFGDGNTSTAQNPMHIFTSEENQTVTLTVSNQCGSDSFSYEVPLFVAELMSGGKVGLFPNPVQSDLIISLDGVNANEIEIILTDITGKVVQRMVVNKSLFNQNITLNMANEPKGVYMVSINANNEILTEKIVKQ